MRKQKKFINLKREFKLVKKEKSLSTTPLSVRGKEKKNRVESEES